MIKTISNQWVLVADGGMAKILSYYDKAFQVIHQSKSPFQHTPSKDIATDKDGNFYAGKHHSKGNSADLHEQAESAFISGLSDLLEKEFYAGKFKELFMVMPPKALGKMRKKLSKNIRAVIKLEISKDLIHIPESELFTKLGKLFSQDTFIN